TIARGGITVFPRLVAADYPTTFDRKLASSGNVELDALVGGGLHTGTSNLLMGPAGSGKSSLACLFAAASAARGEKVIFFAFDENILTLEHRAESIGLRFREHIDSGLLTLRQVDPAEIAPGALADEIVQCVQGHGIRMIVLDSLNGYVNSMPQEDYLNLHLHELLSFLNQRGVVTLMVLAQHGLIGPMGSSVDVSYLADTVILTRFFEAAGAVHKAVSTIKKRSGVHESTIRELRMAGGSISVGAPLSQFQGVLTGVPRFIGSGRDITHSGA
ncbi:MAG: ATPase domain-containing protein, partial [Pseudomonadota bacterium]